jgi:sugar phosphate isomerase/epimerase
MEGQQGKSMNLGARASFDRFDQLEEHYRDVDFPIELALPYRVGDFLAMASRMAEVRDYIRDSGIQVLSVHATQGNLIADDHERWTRPAMELADELGAGSVTFHPNRSKKQRVENQARVKEHILEIQRDHYSLASVETFGGKDRVFRPREIVEADLPMVLDTAHLHSDELILDLIRTYHQNIPALHLSARGESEHHLPIDPFCLEVVAILDELGWGGSVILEYLPWHHYRVREDLELLSRYRAGERDLRPPPPDDKYREDPSMWGFAKYGQFI